MKAADIIPNPDNPRTITSKSRKKLRESLERNPRFMELRKIILDEKNVIVAGNQRFRELVDLGYEEIPDEWIDHAKNFTPEELREFVIMDNVSFGDWDYEVMLQDYQVDEVKHWGVEVPVEMTTVAPPLQEKEEKELEVKKNEYGVKLGDIYTLGNHRLICGDSTLPETIDKLMGSEKADLVFTDPPYGVNVKGGKKKGNTIAGDLTQTAIPFSFELAIERATKEKAQVYFCGGEGNIGLYFKLFERFLAQMPKILVWVKEGFVMKQNGYHNQYELIFYGFKEGGGGSKSWYGGRKMDEASDVWQIHRDATSSYVHPTQKPVELPMRAMLNHSQEGELVYEPFLGSGSTLIACEKLNRRCYGAELDPHYCSVVLKRWEQFTDQKAVKIKK